MSDVELVKDLQQLEVMLENITEETLQTKFSNLIQQTYIEIYENLPEFEKDIVLSGIRKFEMQDMGWLIKHEYQAGKWSSVVYEGEQWVNYKVEFYGPGGHYADWDYDAVNEEDACYWAKYWVLPQNRPWG